MFLGPEEQQVKGSWGFLSPCVDTGDGLPISHPTRALGLHSLLSWEPTDLRNILHVASALSVGVARDGMDPFPSAENTCTVAVSVVTVRGA